MNEEDYFGVLSSPPSQPQLPKANTNNVVMQEDNSVYLMQRVDLEYLKAMKSKLRCSKLANLKIDAALFPSIFAIFNKQIHTLPPRDGVSVFCDTPPLPSLPKPPPSPKPPLPTKRPANVPAKMPAKRPRAPTPPLSESDDEEESEDRWYVNMYREIHIVFPTPIDYSFITFNQNRMAFNTTTEIEDINLGHVHVDIEIVGLPSKTGCCAACLAKYRKNWADKENAMERTVLMCRRIERTDATEFRFEMKFLCPPEHHNLRHYEVFFMVCHLTDRATRVTKMEHHTTIPVYPFRANLPKPNAQKIAVRPVAAFSLHIDGCG